DARKVLEKIRAKDDVDWEMLEIEETIKAQKNQQGTFKAIFASRWMTRVFFLGIGVAVIQQLAGVNAIMYYAPTVLKETGMSTDAALICTIINGVVSVVMTLVGIWLLGKIGRRPLTIIGQLGCMSCLFYLTFILFLTPQLTASGEINLTRSYLVLLGMLLFLCFQQGALSPVTWVLLSEIFPMKIRGLCAGTAILTLWLTNTIVSFIFPILIAHLGLNNTFMIFAGIGVLGSIFVLKCIPETRGRSLEQVEHYFESRFS